MTLKEVRATGKKYRHPHLGKDWFGHVVESDPTCFEHVVKDAITYFPGSPDERKYDSVQRSRGLLTLSDLLDDRWEVET